MDDIRNAKFGLNNPSKHAEKLVKDVRSTSQAEGENAIKVVQTEFPVCWVDRDVAKGRLDV